MENAILRNNEKEANVIVAKVMRITFVIFTIVYFLNVFGVFVIDPTIMTIAYVGGGILLLMPTVLTNVLRIESYAIKYVNVVGAAIFVTLLSITLTYHVVVIYVYPIAIASLYFSKKLNITATGLTVVGVSIGQLLAYNLDTLQDDNFTLFHSVVIFGIIPRALILIAVAAIFTMLASRTAALLSNLMGAEEQEKMLNNMKKMKESASHTSENLFGMVNTLSQIAESSLDTNRKIENETKNLLDFSMENSNAVEEADERVQDISGQLKELSEMNHHTAILTDEIGENTKQNQERMDDATSIMGKINDSTSDCKKIIYNLGEESKEIIGIVATITNISSQTNILALNASIEAARAGENGKGFAVVADEIQKLSEQTKTAVESIGKIVREVVTNTEKAVAAMDKNVTFAQNGMESIQKANESANLITESNKELIKQIHSIDVTAKQIQQMSTEIAAGMKQVSTNTQLNCTAIGQVTEATKNNSEGAQNLAQLVEEIRQLSEKLNNVVGES